MRTEALKMLVVDDNPVLVSVLSQICSEYGHSVQVASDGFVALTEIRKNLPDILVSDLSMPAMSGYELLSVVLRRFPSIHIIAMSGSHSGEGIPAGVPADAFYSKGERSIAQLIDMVSATWHLGTDLPRSSAPVWVSVTSFDYAGPRVVLASCPECLRPFPNCLEGNDVTRQYETCPHCLVPVELAFVRQPARMDGTPISSIPSALQVNHPPLGARRSGGTQTGRMHQQ